MREPHETPTFYQAVDWPCFTLMFSKSAPHRNLFAIGTMKMSVSKYLLIIASITGLSFLAFTWFGQPQLLGLSSSEIDAKLDIGMTKEGVITVFGEPHYKRSFRGIDDHWNYKNAKANCRNLEYPIELDIYFDGNLVKNYLQAVD